MNRYIHALSPVFVIATALMLSGCGTPPQLGDNRDALAAADSLWTAITAKRTDLVESSASRLAQLKQADKILAAMPPPRSIRLSMRPAPANGTRPARTSRAS